MHRLGRAVRLNRCGVEDPPDRSLVASRYPFGGKTHLPTRARPRARSRPAGRVEAGPCSPASPVTSIGPPRSPTSSRPGCSGSAASAYGIPRRAGPRPSDRSRPPVPARAQQPRLASPRLWAAYGPRLTNAYHSRGRPDRPRSPMRNAGRARRPAGASSRRDRATPRSPGRRPRTTARAGRGCVISWWASLCACGLWSTQVRPPSDERITPPSSIPTVRPSGSVGCSAIVLTWWVHGRGGKTSVARSAAAAARAAAARSSPRPRSGTGCWARSRRRRPIDRQPGAIGRRQPTSRAGRQPRPTGLAPRLATVVGRKQTVVERSHVDPVRVVRVDGHAPRGGHGEDRLDIVGSKPRAA